MMPIVSFYIVATPIGNLKDITLRALEVLKEVDLILCEDTRVTKKLCDHHQIKTPLLSYHQHSRLNKINHIIGLLQQGKNLALVSDAGTPGISDPGNYLINQINNYFGQINEEKPPKIIPIPGPSAFAAAASVSGFPMDKFIFLGFPPLKKKRQKFFTKIADSDLPVIFYESPRRILRTMKELAAIKSDLEIVIGRELTKTFETIYRGQLNKIIEEITQEMPRGEFVIITNPIVTKILNIANC